MWPRIGTSGVLFKKEKGRSNIVLHKMRNIS